MFYTKSDFISIFLFGSSIIISILTKNKKIKKSESNKELVGISFGPTGGLFSYNLGVTKYIQENFNLDGLKFAGISGGVQSCILLSFDVPVEKGFEKWLTPLVNDLKGNMILNFFPPLNMMERSKVHLKKCLSKKDLAELNNKFYASITKVFPYPHNLSVSSWDNNFDDVYAGLQASQYLPFLSGYPFCKFRDFFCVDGYITRTFYEPEKGKWIHVNPFKWTNKNVLHGIISLANVSDIEFHNEQFKLGYTDGKKNHSYFVEKGLIEKLN